MLNRTPLVALAALASLVIGCSQSPSNGPADLRGGGAGDLANTHFDLAVKRDLSTVEGDLGDGVTDLSVASDDGAIASDDLAPPGQDMEPLGQDMTTSDLAMAPGGFTTIFTILLENHDYAEIVGSPDAPYINSLIADYGLATNYMDSGIHPSNPNYLELVSGATVYNSFGLVDCDPTGSCGFGVFGTFPVDKDNLGNQLQQAGIPWRTYEESMGKACSLSGAGSYAPKHDPFLYFKDIQNGANNLCADTNVDYSQFAADLQAGTYRYMWITPNLTSDGHDPQFDPVSGLKVSDAWLKIEVAKIIASPVFQKGGILFITWDEAEGRNGDSKDQVPMIIVSPNIKMQGFQSNAAYSHASYLATVEDLFKLPRLGNAAGKPNMMEFFK